MRRTVAPLALLLVLLLVLLLALPVQAKQRPCRSVDEDQKVDGAATLTIDTGSTSGRELRSCGSPPPPPSPTTASLASTTTSATSNEASTTAASVAATTSVSASTLATTTQEASTTTASTFADSTSISSTLASTSAASTTAEASTVAITTSVSATTSASTEAATTSASTTQASTTIAESTALASTSAALTSTTSMEATTTAVVETTTLAETTTVTVSATTSNSLLTEVGALLGNVLGLLALSDVTTTRAVTSTTFASSTTLASSTTNHVATLSAAATTTSTFAASTAAASTSLVVSASTTAAFASTVLDATSAASSVAQSTSTLSTNAASTSLVSSTAFTSSTASTTAASSTLSSTIAASTSVASTSATSSTFAASSLAVSTSTLSTEVISTLLASTGASSSATLSSTAQTITASASTSAATTTVAAGSSLPPVAPSVTTAFYYHAPRYILTTQHTSSSFQNFLPLIQQDYAVFVLQADQDLYVRPSDCAGSGNCCDSPVVAPCCSDCSGGSTNQTNCICPTAPASVCVDDVNPMSGAAPFSQSVFYELALLSTCQNVIITLETTSGDADLYARLGAQPDALNEHVPYNSDAENWDWSSVNPGSDSIVFCCNYLEGNTLTPFPSSPAMGSADSYERSRRRTLSGIGTSRLYLQVLSWSAAARWTLRVTVGSALNPSPLLSLQSHYWMLPRTYLECGSTRCYNSPSGDLVPFPCLMQSLPSLDRNDPFSTWLTRSVNSNFSSSDILSNQATFMLLLSSTGAGQADPPILLSNCSIVAPDILDSNGRSVFSQPIAVSAAPPLDCDAAQLGSLVAAFESFAEMPTPSQDLQSDQVQLVSATVGSRGWAACNEFVQSFVATTDFTLLRSTTACLAARGTEAYLQDPCCNPLLLFEQCCAPRLQVDPTRTANLAAVEEQCRTPTCSAQAVNQLALFERVRTDPQVGCDARTLQSTRYIGLSPNPVSIGSGGSCARFLTWANGSSPFDPELTECALSSVESSSFILAAFASFVFNISAARYPTNAAFIADFEMRFRERYASQSICQQPGVPANSIGDLLRNESLDFDAAACTTTPTCNWDFLRTTNESCFGEGYRGSEFCGYCHNGTCVEISDQRGCSIRSDYYSSGGLPSYCASIGGVLMSNEPLAGDQRGFTCFLPNATSQIECFNSSECFYVQATSSPPSLLCVPGCKLTTMDQSNCTCSPLPEDILIATECNYLFYDTNSDTCWHTGVLSTADCEARNGTWSGGQEWHEGYLDNATLCASAVGICMNDPSIMTASQESECLGSCSVRCGGTTGGCDQTTCESILLCSDLFEIPSTGACITQPTIDQLLLTPLCAAPSFLTSLGCADPSPGGDLCEINGGRWYIPGNVSSCGDSTGCFEPDLAISQSNTFRNTTACVACGGTPFPLYSVVSGAWTPYTWQSISWLPRSFQPAASYAPAFAIKLFSADYDSVTSALEWETLKSHLTCQFSQPAHLMSQLVCDCSGGSPGQNCYPVRGNLVGLQRFCTGSAANFTAGNALLIVPSTAEFADGCTDASFYQVVADPFKESASIRSSLFLASIASGSRSIVRNSKHVRIGQIVGDGLQLEIDDATGLVLCLSMRSDLGDDVSNSYSIPDFATCDASFDTSSFRPLYLTDAQVIDGAVCASLREPFTRRYFPIMRLANSAEKDYFDVLTKSQKAAFYAALVLYLLLACVAYYRLLSAICYSIIVSRSGMLIGIWSLVAVILTLRWIYFALAISSQVAQGQAADYVMSELPTTLFFTLFSFIVLFWALLYHSLVRVRGDFKKRLMLIFVPTNVLLYIFLIAVIVIYIRNAGYKASPCGESTSSDTAATVAKAYKVTLSVIVFALGVAFLVYGIVLARMLSKMRNSPEGRRKYQKLLAIAISFPIALALQCALLLYGTFGPIVDTGVALFLLIIVELVPLLLLSWSLALPQLYVNYFSDLVWFFFYDTSGAASVVSSTKDNRSNNSIVSITANSGGL